MTILKTLHAEYLTQQAKIEGMKLDAQNIGDEIQVLQSQLAEAIGVGTALESRINNSSYDMAAGKLSAVEFMQLKQDLEVNKLLITGLQELIPVQEAAKKLIIGSGYPRSGLGTEDAVLAMIQIKISEELLKNAIAQLPTQFLAEIQNITKLMACGEVYRKSFGNTRGARLYDELGSVLSMSANPETPFFSFDEAHDYRDSLIAAL